MRWQSRPFSASKDPSQPVATFDILTFICQNCSGHMGYALDDCKDRCHRLGRTFSTSQKPIILQDSAAEKLTPVDLKRSVSENEEARNELLEGLHFSYVTGRFWLQDEVTDDGEDAEEDAKDGDVGPPKRLGPEAEQREDGSCGDFELDTILHLDPS